MVANFDAEFQLMEQQAVAATSLPDVRVFQSIIIRADELFGSLMEYISFDDLPNRGLIEDRIVTLNSFLRKSKEQLVKLQKR